jgi:O-antigen/teichoic acid export membrane protein
MAGRLLLSVARLGVALAIVRIANADLLGAYVLLLSLLALPEWLVDLGQTDIAVRDISRTPARGPAIIAALRRLRVVQSLLLLPVVPAGLWLAGQPEELVVAGVVASASLPLLGAALSARAELRANMRMGADIAAELAGMALMLPATIIACAAGWGIVGLGVAYLLGRAGWLAAAWMVAPVRVAPTANGTWADARALLRTALPLGTIGLLVGVYDAMAPVLLAGVTGMDQVAAYGVASRYALPALLVLQALTGAFFPLLAASWPGRVERLALLQRMALDVSLFLAIGLACGLTGAATFLMGLFGPAMREEAGVLQVMALVVVARTISTAMVPLIVVAGWQGRAVALTIASLAGQLVGLLAVVPAHGALGAAAVCLVIELATSVVGIGWLAYRATGIGFAWRVPLRLLVAGAVAGAVVLSLPVHGTLAGGMLAGGLFVLLSCLSGVLSPTRLRDVAAALASRHVDPEPA